jgi:hypothetical protein
LAAEKRESSKIMYRRKGEIYVNTDPRNAKTEGAHIKRK